MRPRVLRRADHRRMPWKNGGGETFEIAVGPDGAGLDTFAWRVSLALVERDGPFSVFPGIDRILTVVEGGGIALDFGPERRMELSRVDAPFEFPGEAPVLGHLLDGPIVDLNVMTRRGAARATVERFAKGWKDDLPPGRIGIVYCHRGHIGLASPDWLVTLEEGDAALIERPSRLRADVDGLGFRIDIAA